MKESLITTCISLLTYHSASSIIESTLLGHSNCFRLLKSAIALRLILHFPWKGVMDFRFSPNDLKWELHICFADMVEHVDRHCLNYLFIYEEKFWKNEHKMAGHIRTNKKNKHSQLNQYIKSSLFQGIKNVKVPFRTNSLYFVCKRIVRKE